MAKGSRLQESCIRKLGSFRGRQVTDQITECVKSLHLWSGSQRKAYTSKLKLCREKIRLYKKRHDMHVAMLVIDTRKKLRKLLAQQDYWKEAKGETVMAGGWGLKY